MADVAQGFFLPNCHALLTSRGVRFKELTGFALPQTPSSRFRIGAYVLPGSQSSLSHVIFLSLGSRQELLIAVYSKTLTFKEFEYEKLLAKACEFNSTETQSLWRIERKHGSLYPILEMTLFPLPAEALSPDLIWKSLGSLDLLFKAKAESFKSGAQREDLEVQKQVRTFLEYMGFKKIKEQAINGGVSYLVVLSNDDEDEGSIWKRFPLKIEVAALITHRIYFSINDAAVTARKGFISSSKMLMAQVNAAMSIGFYTFIEATKQVQLIFKTHYQGMAPSDIWQSLRVDYDVIIQFYKWTAPAFVQLYLDVIDRTKSASELGMYLLKINAEIQGEEMEKVLDYSGDEDSFLKDLGLFRKLGENVGVSKYLLRKPWFDAKENVKKVRVKSIRSLIPYSAHFDRFPYTRDRLILKTVELFDALVPLCVFPSLNMLFCSPPPSLDLTIVPDKGLHQSAERFLDEVMNHTLSGFAEIKTSLSRTLKEDYLKHQYSDFEPSFQTSINEYFFSKGRLGSEDYIFYKLIEVRPTRLFILLLEQYRSQISQLPNYPNPIIGWTSATDEELQNAEPSADSVYTSGINNYVVERYQMKIWKGDQADLVWLEVARQALEMQAQDRVHWLINPITIRYNPRTKEVALVLPCLHSSNLEFLYSFLPREYRKFLAPEIRQFHDLQIPVLDLYQPDVYSLAKMMMESMKMKKETMSLNPVEQRIVELAERGLKTDPKTRPRMSEMYATLREIFSGSRG